MSKEKNGVEKTEDVKEISAKQAVIIAVKFYQEVSGSEETGSLEEVEYKEDGYWYITLGFTTILLIPSQKIYRVFKVNAVSEKVESMKLRES
jgi:hypothetical protein